MTSSIVNKLLHHPIVALKTHARDHYRDMYLEVARNMFNLAEEEKEETEESLED